MLNTRPFAAQQRECVRALIIPKTLVHFIHFCAEGSMKRNEKEPRHSKHQTDTAQTFFLYCCPNERLI